MQTSKATFDSAEREVWVEILITLPRHDKLLFLSSPTSFPTEPVLKSVMLVVKDTKRSREFYAQTLGLEAKIDADDFVSVVTPNGVEIELHAPHEGHTHVVEPNSAQLSLEVKDVDNWHSTMRKRGVEFSQGPKEMPWGTREAYLKDPDGYLIAVVERSPKGKY